MSKCVREREREGGRERAYANMQFVSEQLYYIIIDFNLDLDRLLSWVHFLVGKHGVVSMHNHQSCVVWSVLIMSAPYFLSDLDTAAPFSTLTPRQLVLRMYMFIIYVLLSRLSSAVEFAWLAHD